MSSFDPHTHRARLKLLERGHDRALYENRDGVRCPVCDRRFQRVLATAERSRQLAPEEGVELCVLREETELFLFTHH